MCPSLPSPQEDPISPTENDVLMGRGPAVRLHPGCFRFREIVAAHQKLYKKASRNEKAVIVKMVVEEIQDTTPPTRFLEQQKDGTYEVVAEKRIMAKTAQALREKKPYQLEKGVWKRTSSMKPRSGNKKMVNQKVCPPRENNESLPSGVQGGEQSRPCGHFEDKTSCDEHSCLVPDPLTGILSKAPDHHPSFLPVGVLDEALNGLPPFCSMERILGEESNSLPPHQALDSSELDTPAMLGLARAASFGPWDRVLKTIARDMESLDPHGGALFELGKGFFAEKFV